MKTQKIVAIKKLSHIFDNVEDCKKMVREILLLKALNDSPYVTKLLDIIKPKDTFNFSHLFIVVEYVSSDIKKIIKSDIVLT